MKIARAVLLSALGAAFPAFAADVSVSQENQTFSVSVMNLHVGDKIAFDNQDEVTHNIMVKGGANDDVEDLGLQKPGKSVNYTFVSNGSYRIMCSIHPRMRMSINVQ